MLAVYLNYPNPRISAHPGMTSEGLRRQRKTDQRLIRINTITFSEEIARFGAREHTFAPNVAFNDMWLEIDFNDPTFEMAVLAYIHLLLGKRYAPFANAPINVNTP